MRWISALTDLLFYSNLWIAVGALCTVWQTERLLTGAVSWGPYLGFILFGTLALYAIHRLFGLARLPAFAGTGRYRVIADHRRSIAWYAAFSLLAAVFFFFQLPKATMLALLLPGAIALLYVLPILGRSRRLRDFDYMKIFLIAGVWSWVSVGIPAGIWSSPTGSGVEWLLAERFLFIFAITLPFDIRDEAIDKHTGVHTLPSILGKPLTRLLAALCLLAMVAAAACNPLYAHPRQLVALGLSAVPTYLLIHFAWGGRHDYYFTGLIDGTMILQFVMIYLAG